MARQYDSSKPAWISIGMSINAKNLPPGRRDHITGQSWSFGVNNVIEPADLAFTLALTVFEFAVGSGILANPQEFSDQLAKFKEKVSKLGSNGKVQS